MAKRLATFAEVADLLGETGPDRVRRVRRRLLRHANAADIVVRFGNTNPCHKGARYMVSLAALRLYIPQTKSHRDDMIAMVREQFEDLHEKVAEAREEVRVVASEAGVRIRALEAEIKQLKARAAAA